MLYLEEPVEPEEAEAQEGDEGGHGQGAVLPKQAGQGQGQGAGGGGLLLQAPHLDKQL